MDPQLGDLDLSFVGCGGRRTVERRHRLVGPTHRLQEQTPRVEQVRVLRFLREAGIVEREEHRVAFGGELLTDRLVHFLLIERGAAFEAGRREHGRDAAAQRAFVLVLGDLLLRAPRWRVLDEMQGREHLVRGDGPDLRDPRQLVDRGPCDLPEGVVPAVDQRLGPGRVEAEDLQQVDEGGRVGFPVDAPLRTACGGRDRRGRGGGRPLLVGGGCPEARVALVADDLPGVPSAAFGTRGLPFELAGLAQDRRGTARFAQDEREEFPAAGAAGAKIFDVLRHGRASHRLSAESRRGEERGL